MKRVKSNSKIILTSLMLAVLVFQTSCRKELLDLAPTTEVAAENFWQNEADATIALFGAYAATRAVFNRDYYFDGHGEYTRVRGTSATSGNILRGDPYQGANYDPSGYAGSFDKYFRYLYGAVNRCNYVIENVATKMLPTASGSSLTNLETILGEARLLRGMTYFRLISMWGDVPYFTKVVQDNEEAGAMFNLGRTPIAQVKDSIMADFNYAFEKLPAKASALGRASKPAALAFRGKLHLYWASWKKNGWPELEGFQQNAAEATASYTAAAADFKKVIDNYGLTLYKNGDPGQIDALGKAEILPNYFELFTPKANGNPEMIMVFTHAGTPTNPSQGEELMRDFSGRTIEGSQCWVAPRYELADRYQLISTGDFAPKMVQMNPTTNAAARTTPNSAVNPNTYANRDYRMKATIVWDYEMQLGLASLKSTGFAPFIYQAWAANVTINGVNYITYNTDGTNSGYVFRKFVRNYEGLGRSEGDYAYPVMRLADVYLMYAEATNEVSGPQMDAIGFVNLVRRRGNLPALKADRTTNRQAFFDAIEQERIVELVAEGHRGFDLRRWRAIERVWGPPGSAGVWRQDTYGANQQRYYQNTSDRTYQQNYIFRIPPGERDRNPNLTQNIPWR